MSTPDEEWIEASLSAAAPAAHDQCTLAPAEFDLGRLQAWQAGADDPEAVAHLSTCAFCRSLLPGLAMPQTDAMTRALADRIPRRGRWRIAVGAAIACAAAMLFFVLRPTPVEPFDPSTVPTGGLQYTEASFKGGLAVTKSATGTTRFTPESTLRWILRPPSVSVRAQSAKVYRIDPAGALTDQPADIKLLPTGAVRITIAGAQLPTGRISLLAVVSKDATLDLTGRQVKALHSIADASFFLRQIQVDLASR